MQYTGDPDQENDDLPQYEHIYQNDFSFRKHKKQKEEDIAICDCKFDFGDPDSACGERCLNVLTSTECTPGYCPCGVYCKNQKYQKYEYSKTKLFKTEGRGWGLLAAENIKSGQFIIEYCGEVISWKEAKRRSQVYELHGLKDAFIISLNATEAIDATVKGSLARFINHSCQPNCETRKWTVLGEVRVGIFARKDISAGTELAYDYNFEWYGGAKVRCLCGSPNCSGFLGAKSRGFQEDTYVWVDGDDRYSVEKIPLYDSAEDEPSSMLPKTTGLLSSDTNGENDISMGDCNIKLENDSDSSCLGVKLPNVVPGEEIVEEKVKIEPNNEVNVVSHDSHESCPKGKAIIPRVRTSASRAGPPVSKKRVKQQSGGKLKQITQKPVDPQYVADLLAIEEARDEVLKYMERKNEANARLTSMYDEIRPAIEEHESDNQDSVATSVAEKWIEACCFKLKAELDLYASLVKNIACTPTKLQERGSNGSWGGGSNC